MIKLQHLKYSNTPIVPCKSNYCALHSNVSAELCLNLEWLGCRLLRSTIYIQLCTLLLRSFSHWYWNAIYTTLKECEQTWAESCCIVSRYGTKIFKHVLANANNSSFLVINHFITYAVYQFLWKQFYKAVKRPCTTWNWCHLLVFKNAVRLPLICRPGFLLFKVYHNISATKNIVQNFACWNAIVFKCKMAMVLIASFSRALR